MVLWYIFYSGAEQEKWELKTLGKPATMENQNLEMKETWRDEYMKTLCAFANASGGTVEIGKGDDGVVIGVEDAAKLLENLPNKIKNAMAIVADVTVHNDDGKEYIAVTVGAFPFPMWSSTTSRATLSRCLGARQLKAHG